MTNEEKEQARMENENYDFLLSLEKDNWWYGAKRNLYKTAIIYNNHLYKIK